MTYCVGVLVEEGLVMVADTRTNAGLDDISTYRKLHHFNVPGERVMMLASAGNLSITQSVLSLLQEGVPSDDGEPPQKLIEAPTMFQAAQLIGRAIRRVRAIERDGFEAASIRFSISLLFGGQIAGEGMRLFLIYSAGNFIECSTDAPFLQIGEHKYGKPILDRAVKFESDLYDALKVSLVSMDSTMRSNLGVGLPIDIAVARRNGLDLEVNHRIEAGEGYFHDLRERWSAALRAAHRAIPRPPYGPTAK
ncbi:MULTISPECIES: peptidase [Methylobacterium]|jgi:putative proteasome-type protease|uniref:peptidase n=1 Tax=Methylobacterium TaxID=407 RepID=UPI0011C1FFE2|nr:MULTISPECIES: peptidase [Methylobacterium]QEE39672.1 peptidase [Methylobacterium sp. WL1]TXN05634.1 peptidase [Methylobacterium sp. WL64]TXN47248.1 peptidase [Methylobacterium sp. WL7]TXN55734.1 peptidase [Methylobacterium sp. WL2]TXN64495.1 peptidase [Methylobacterium sp. WL18]